MKVGRGRDGKVEQGGGGRQHPAPRSVSTVRSSFGASMENAAEELEIRELLERLDAVAARLSVFPAERLLFEYRGVLKELLARAVKRFTLRRDMQWRRSSRGASVTLERAEAAMAELEDAFLKEGDRTKALRLMEEIKGCLISLLL